MTSKISKRQEAILQYIHQFDGKHGFVPSIREIGEEVGISSTSVVRYNIEKLVSLKYLTKTPSKSRAFNLTSKAYEVLAVPVSEMNVSSLWHELCRLRSENEQLQYSVSI
jgi:repressor LexA